MPTFNAHATVNYPETEVDTPDHVTTSVIDLLRWVDKLMKEPDATSFVIVISRKD